jgi:hypothetical protein
LGYKKAKADRKTTGFLLNKSEYILFKFDFIGS